MLVARGLEPQRQPRDLDQLGVEIDAVEILGDDLVERIEVDGLAKRGETLDARARYSAASRSKAATRKAPEPQAGSTMRKAAQRAR